MQRVYESGASAVPPTPPAIPSIGYPSRGNPAAGAMPTVPGPYMMHQLVEELMAVITAGGIAPDPLTLDQLKLALDAVYVKRNGTSPILQNFPGLTRSLTALGGGLVREYVDIPNAATVGGIEICTVYNCAIDPVTGIWAGRDIADICWLEKWHDVAGTKELWIAPTAAAATVPVWVNVFSLNANNGNMVIAGTLAAAAATLPTHLLRQDQATAQFTPASYSSKNINIAANTAFTAAQCLGQMYVVNLNNAVLSLPAPNANGEITLIGNMPIGSVISVPAGVILVYPDSTQVVGGAIALGYRDVVTLTSNGGAWFITSMTGQPIVKPATLPNQAVAMSQAFGIAQTWQNVTATRAAGVTYTNSTGRLKKIKVSALGTVANSSASIYPIVATVSLPTNVAYVLTANAGWLVTSDFEVAPGQTYSITLAGSVLSGWFEF
jgi:hypothetical protein